MHPLPDVAAAFSGTPMMLTYADYTLRRALGLVSGSLDCAAGLADAAHQDEATGRSRHACPPHGRMRANIVRSVMAQE
jgi:hypothetical protein